MKSAEAHQSFPTSGSNDLLLSGVLLSGPHRCADEVFTDLPSDVGLPRSVGPLNSLHLASACATTPRRLHLICGFRSPNESLLVCHLVAARIRETTGANSGKASRPAARLFISPPGFHRPPSIMSCDSEKTGSWSFHPADFRRQADIQPNISPTNVHYSLLFLGFFRILRKDFTSVGNLSLLPTAFWEAGAVWGWTGPEPASSAALGRMMSCIQHPARTLAGNDLPS